MPNPIPGRDGIPASAIVHSCGAWWTGAERSHCGGCHLTFTSLTAFDNHRRGQTCNDPATVGLEKREAAFGALWGFPQLSEEQRARMSLRWASAGLGGAA